MDYTPPFELPPFVIPGQLQYTATLSAPATLNTSGVSGTAVFTVSAPIGDQVEVMPVTADAGTTFEIILSYNGNSDPGFNLGPATVSFTDLQGSAPIFDDTSGVSWDGSQSHVNFHFVANDIAAFSFTSITFTQAITGTGNATTQNLLTYQIQVYDNSYAGDAPPDNPVLLSISPVPEPSICALAGVGMLSLWTTLARRKTRRA